jgi:hypothetical protein
MMYAIAAAAALWISPAGQAARADLGPERTARLESCGVDAGRLDALLALDQQAFDQDVSGGWRTVAARPGCDAAAADLIEVWRDHAPGAESARMLNWHAGQMRAFAGERDAAVALFDDARGDARAWSLYVDASIAFLQRDRAALEAARAELATLTPSAGQQAARRRFLLDNPDISMPEGFVDEPQNLNVVDRLSACFDGSYAGAYTGRCDAPEPVTTPPDGCAFAAARFARAQAAAADTALAISPNWSAGPVARTELADLLSQRGRGGGNAPFGFEYNADFAAAAEALTGEDMDRIADAWSAAAPIDCPAIDTAAPPFNADMAAFDAWAQAAMLSPGPDDPDGASTLAVSRPVLFDGADRLIVIEQSSFTPIPLSRPPSALVAVVIYARAEADWVREASIIVARGG